MSHLTTLIELNRKKMIELSKLHGMSSSEVIKCSQELDVLIHVMMDEKHSAVECTDIQKR
ncbi:aspartyl-phosphate phosphatase Spo0E family protein [Bacillus sp. ISL-55]|uniref:aspartyl-phosphate phosphatase Spo0E family protein n=1 Tax=Bacillus sp. ISL-55 TaxID=2819134 RepID=UPI001BE5C06C|nr:aspartyl-phosphate phosphatase Spo0E family protein [Bacillus sp. ISL-55]MBT2693627.1 aspartyl-phosphate phosphatase Spo0E family protein [Bacillus sp. ISL-55]